ncbi:hypothetical protein EZS27_023628 [termite gut metagenome]|uniref:Uncharacterized protein n=1 Tax=termite gut metagenome TaxID=433724 RepID=A0A5J4R0Z9_9ZZZZ
MLKEIFSKAISGSDGEGKIILVGEIISSLI